MFFENSEKGGYFHLIKKMKKGGSPFIQYKGIPPPLGWGGVTIYFVDKPRFHDLLRI